MTAALERVREIVGDTPHMTFAQATRLSDVMASINARDVLELGFRHGVSTCYMAAFLEERGGGHITTIDLELVREIQPNIDTLLDRANVGHMVTRHFEPTSYVWRLMRMLEESAEPRFDLCYLDGAHSWFVDGFAFFLVNRLLRPGGWIVLDDLDWTYASSPTLRETPWVRKMPDDERNEPQVRKVYELLVKTHADYDSFRTEDGWAFARKRPGSAGTEPPKIITETVFVPQPSVLRSLLRRVTRG